MTSKEWVAFIWDTVIVLVLLGIGIIITASELSDWFVIGVGLWLICLLLYFKKTKKYRETEVLDKVALLLADLIIVSVIVIIGIVLISLGISIYFMWACLLFVAYFGLTVAYKND